MRVTDAQYAALLRRQGRPASTRTTLPVREHDEQAAVIAWARIMVGRYPDLRWLASIPNGGLRDKATAARMAAEGVNAGIPDLLLAVPRGHYHGLFVELKTPTGRLSDAQAAWLAHLRAVGYMAVVAVGAQAAIDAITHYLESAP